MKTLSLASLLCSAAMFASTGSAQNILTNPGFENGLAGWSTFGGNVFAEMTSGGPSDGEPAT